MVVFMNEIDMKERESRRALSSRSNPSLTTNRGAWCAASRRGRTASHGVGSAPITRKQTHCSPWPTTI
jgi:hypothetical protein